LSEGEKARRKKRRERNVDASLHRVKGNRTDTDAEAERLCHYNTQGDASEALHIDQIDAASIVVA
jgi:hypothetical protein